MSEKKLKIRSIRPPKKINVQLAAKPDLEDMDNDIRFILRAEISEMRKRVESGNRLTITDVNKLDKASQIIRRRGVEEREQHKYNNPTEWTDEMLLELGEEAMKVLAEGGVSRGKGDDE